MDKTLYDYLESVVSMEKALYTQNKAITQTEETMESLAIPIIYEKPRRPHEVSSFSFEGFKGFSAAGLFFGGIVGLFAGNFFLCVFAGFVIGLLIMTLIVAISDNSENKSLDEQYEAEMREYNCSVEEDAKRVERERIEKARLNQILSMMEDKRDDTEALLKQYYSTGIIFPKYRNLVAVCSLLEYFMSGSCDTLKEAYNKYDNEVLFKQVITKLDDILHSLDSIKENQYMLYDAIKEGNRISQQLVNESVRQSGLIEKSIDYQALQVSYSAQIESEERFRNNFMIYEAWRRNRLN